MAKRAKFSRAIKGFRNWCFTKIAELKPRLAVEGVVPGLKFNNQPAVIVGELLERLCELGLAFRIRTINPRSYKSARATIALLQEILNETDADNLPKMITRALATTNLKGRGPVLSHRKSLILQALQELKAGSPYDRVTTKQVAKAAEGPAANPDAFKEPIAELVKDGFVKSKAGRGGGCWLTKKGLNY